VITEVDVLRSNYKSETKNRKRFDNIRDELDSSQCKLVRNVINDNTKQFIELTKSLKEVNEELRQTIEDVDQVALTLETLVEFIDAVQKIAELMP
jgi:DNA anti-recombination protein RmuC